MTMRKKKMKEEKEVIDQKEDIQFYFTITNV